MKRQYKVLNFQGAREKSREEFLELLSDIGLQLPEEILEDEERLIEVANVIWSVLAFVEEKTYYRDVKRPEDKQWMLALCMSALGVLSEDYKVIEAPRTDHPDTFENEIKEDCAFCRQKVIEEQSYFEGEHVRVYINYRPLLPGHSMIIPKRHVTRFEDLEPEELIEMHAMAKKMRGMFQDLFETEDYVLVLQNGFRAGQTEEHIHMHILPKKENDLSHKLKMWSYYLTSLEGLRQPLIESDIDELVNRLKNAIKKS